MSLKGNIHSFESFGTVDGPGIRFVVFMQGCPLRCLYCHNPDTWDVNRPGSFRMTPVELLDEVLKYRSFIAKGGVTVSGGEPLLQAPFLKEFFILCREEGIHTTLDTSGCLLTPQVAELLDVTELVLLDIKSADPSLHKRLTGGRMESVRKFLDNLQNRGKGIWVRHVIVPGWTADEEQLRQLADMLTNYTVIKKIDLIPYHTMGVDKYASLSLDYPLKGVHPLSGEELEKAHTIFQQYGLPV